jgi:two-component system sensor histidine kinase UhpB
MWYGRPLRTQLLIAFIITDLIVALIAGVVTIFDARASTRVEIAASMRLAELLVRETVDVLEHVIPAGQFLTGLPLQQRFLRHVRISVVDAAGQPIASRAVAGPSNGRVDEHSPAPAWFAALIAPAPEQREIPVVVKGQRIGSVFVTGEPADEIAETWKNTITLGSVALAVNIAAIALLYVLFGRVLGPLTGLVHGLHDLERRNYDVRLPRPQSPELAAITDRFNALAEALDVARAENTRLARRVITAQDDERRRTAIELHDEVGPCLFGLKANAASIASAVGKPPNVQLEPLQERVRDMLSIIDRLQSLNRGLLKRLRPMALGHVPLRDLLAEMVSERTRQCPDISFSFSAERLRPSYGDSIDLTIYRCLQESLTNAIRHAQGTRIDVGLREENGSAPGARLTLTVNDNGRGIDPGTPPGFGLTGMQERVRAMGGECVVESATDGGTAIRVRVPVSTERPAAGGLS